MPCQRTQHWNNVSEFLHSPNVWHCTGGWDIGKSPRSNLCVSGILLLLTREVLFLQRHGVTYYASLWYTECGTAWKRRKWVKDVYEILVPGFSYLIFSKKKKLWHTSAFLTFIFADCNSLSFSSCWSAIAIPKKYLSHWNWCFPQINAIFTGFEVGQLRCRLLCLKLYVLLLDC